MPGARAFGGLRALAVSVAAVALACAAMTSSALASSLSGPHHVVTAGTLVRLNGRAPIGASSTPPVYRWRIVKQPASGRAKLEQPTAPDPGFVANVPGTYRVRSTTKAANGPSVDTVTVIVRADAPPIGWRLETAANDQGTIMLNGEAVPDTTAQGCEVFCSNRASYAVFNRQTLGRVESGTTGNLGTLLDLAKKYNAAPTFLMVVNFNGVSGSDADERALLETLGVAKVSDADLVQTFVNHQVSIVGVPGSPAGSAFISNDFPDRYQASRRVANMSGYLRLNPLSVNGNFEFVLTDQTEFNTDASSTPSQITMKVGDQTYAHSVPAGSGFFLVRLNSRTFAKDNDFFYVTNRPDGSQVPEEAKRMAADIAWSSSPRHQEHGDQLVMLQAFGRPSGTSGGWMQAAQAIQRLGGNAQVFAQMNQGYGDEPHGGRYAFVARAGTNTPEAESSQPLTGRAGDGVLHGLLARGRDYQYQPLLADPAGTVNFELVNIVNRPSPAGGGFPTFTTGERAAESFLGRDPDIIGVCDQSAPTCDVRKAYYEDYAGVNWANILTRLGEPAKLACVQPHAGFTPGDCEKVRVELALEIGRRNTVEEYFGPKGLQAPFGATGVGALVDIAKLADQIKTAVRPPEEDRTATNVLSIISNIVKAGALVNGGAGPAAALSGAFSLAAYLTKPNGKPDLIGPQIDTAAANLGGDLVGRYEAASSYFTTESKIIMSDWSKLRDVAAAVHTPAWRLDDIPRTTETVRLATRQAIYQALIPVAYPVLYDLGGRLLHAKDWYCSGGIAYDKHLFQNTGTGAELTYKSDPNYYNEVIAIGARHTVGRLHDAYIPAPPESVTGPLFRAIDSPQGDGIGLYKLEFYSPQNFYMYPRPLSQGIACSGIPDPPDNSG